MSNRGRPGPDEAAAYYFHYIDLVPDGDIYATLGAQLADTVGLLESVPADGLEA